MACKPHEMAHALVLGNMQSLSVHARINSDHSMQSLTINCLFSAVDSH
jgi:hypothetical protein